MSVNSYVENHSEDELGLRIRGGGGEGKGREGRGVLLFRIPSLELTIRAAN